MSIQQKTKPATREQIVSMRQSGLSYAEIGLRFNLSRERIRQIYNNSDDKQTKSSRIGTPLTTSDVAHLLNIHINTVRRWSNKGILKSYRIGPRGDRRFNREDINSVSLESIRG